MKNIYLFLLLISSTLFAQNFEKKWTKVIELESKEKIKSANNIVENIYEKASDDKNEIQIIKCFFYKSKYMQILEENAQSKILDNLKSDINKVSIPSKAILNLVYAKCLKEYLNKKRYQLYRRTKLDSTANKNFLTWTQNDFETEIEQAYDRTIENETVLKKIQLSYYESIFDYLTPEKFKTENLFEYLLTENIIHYSYNISTWQENHKDYLDTKDKFLGDSESFRSLDLVFIKEEKFKKILSFYQKLEEKQSLEKQFDRIEFCNDYLLNSDNDYLKSLNILQKKNPDEILFQKIVLKKALIYKNQASKGKYHDYNNKAIGLLDSIISIKNNSNTYNLALNEKQSITNKSLTVELQKYIYPNENTRAFVTYKNVDNIKISFYRFTKKDKEIFETLKFNKDSLFNAFILRNKPVKSISNELINKKDYFDYTTEIILPQLETGNYLVYFESDNQEKTNPVFSYEIITVSDLILLSNRKNEKDIYQVLNRKTGKPIENVSIKSDTFEISTNNEGIATTATTNRNYNSKPLGLTKQNDTIQIARSYPNYSNDYIDEENDDFIAKVEFYLDRAIYRPGQTLYYKGIAVQKKKGINKTVPNLLVKIIIEDADYNELKEFEVTTNEFGSFSGEFILPKNGSTGNFKISAEEPEDSEKDPLYDRVKDEHPFWDNIDFNHSEISFKVEEYKRPKFEVTFENTKDNLVINENISVKGKAKAFSGSNISDAKVNYTIVRQTYNSYRSYYPDNYETIETGETKTDTSGKFTIDFIAKPDNNTNKANLPIFSYKIKADITDINGETRSNETNVKVGYHSLALKTFVPKTVKTKDLNKIQITSTNLNNEFTATKGELKIYFIKEYSKKFKSRIFSKPEIESISNEDFNTLFPFEINEKQISENDKGELVFTKKIDTNLETEFPLSFIQNYKSGYYKLVFTASDKQNNPIESVSNFELIQSNNSINTNKLLTIEQLNNDIKKDGFITLKITSIIPELYINTVGNYKFKVFYDQNIELKNNEAIIKIPIQNEFINSIKIGFQTIFENESFTDEFETIIKNEQPKIDFETNTFRSKIEPGNKEFWSFKLKQKDNKTETEILASMYDLSLDQFAKSEWQDLAIRDNNSNYINYKTVSGIDKIYFSVNNLNSYIPFSGFKNEYTKLMWFGFDFNNVNNVNINKEYRNQLTKKSKIPLNSEMVSGIVTDASGPIPGVNVVVKGTQRGVSTDFDGSYSIKVAPEEVLVFSFMGMNDISRTVDTNRVINVKMKDESMHLEVVVVTALGVKRKQDAITSSYTVVKSEELNRYSNETIIQALKGKISGLQINQSDSGFSRVVFRGSRSTANNNGALIIIDGAISNASILTQLSSEDIISVNSLKGVEASALYGADGINGVIIITTKKGIQELTQVKARTNLSETAFFFPHLRTDKSGNVSFNFTSPEALTEWRFRLFAHNKEATTGYFQKSVVTQKDLMVTPNFPRFLREKDSILITTKIANITGVSKTGVAMLQFSDATTMENMDKQMLNSNTIKNFNIKPFGNTTVSWKIYIPEGLQGVQYKVLAKSGDFSDGEENILPVLTNNILVTESIPIWVRENSKKEYVFENLKNNISSTLRNHQFTFEYTSNPTWLAIQSLPYLMEYEHECAEQTFSRYYANALASEIINSNPKIATVFNSWKKNEKLDSKLEQNEELKSILLAETPWLLDSKSEEEKKKNLALLFDLDKMKNSLNLIFEKLKQKQKSSGGFVWFDGGDESEYITRHIIAGIGHLQKLTKNDTISSQTDEIIKKGIPFIDSHFIKNHENRIKSQNGKNKFIWLNPNSDLHYLYTRSFYLTAYPINDNLKTIIPTYLDTIKENWTTYTLYEKAMATLVLSRFKEQEGAKRILESLKETASNNEDWGMYWIENKSGWYWYQAPIETQALLIEAFAEVTHDTKSVDAMKVWLLKNKQAKNWPTTKSTTEAVYALLMQGTDWLSVKDNTFIKIGDEKILTKKINENQKEAESGYIKLTWKADEIKKEMASIKIENKSKVTGYGGIYWQYFEDLDKIKNNNKGSLSINKELYIKKRTEKGDVLQKISSNNPLNIGDLVTVRLVISNKEDIEFVHLKDMRAACFEPINVLSEYQWKDRLGYYVSTKDVATHFFFDKINKGTYVLEYDIRVNNIGEFSNGITTIQSMYTPEFSSHTKGVRISTN